MPPASGRDSRGGGVHELPHAAGPVDVDPLEDAKSESQSPTSSHTAYVVFSHNGKHYFGSEAMAWSEEPWPVPLNGSQSLPSYSSPFQ